MSDNLELTAAITTDEPEVAATLDELRYLVFKGMQGDSAYEEAVKLGFEGTEEEWLASLKGEQGEPGKAKSAYLDYDVVRLIEDDSIYTSLLMRTDIDNGVLPFVLRVIESDSAEEYFELDYQQRYGANPVVYFRSKEHLLSVDSTGHFTLTDRPQGGGSPNAVLYTPQTLTDAQQEQARGNIGAASSDSVSDLDAIVTGRTQSVFSEEVESTSSSYVYGKVNYSANAGEKITVNISGTAFTGTKTTLYFFYGDSTTHTSVGLVNLNTDLEFTLQDSITAIDTYRANEAQPGTVIFTVTKVSSSGGIVGNVQELNEEVSGIQDTLGDNTLHVEKDHTSGSLNLEVLFSANAGEEISVKPYGTAFAASFCNVYARYAGASSNTDLGRAYIGQDNSFTLTNDTEKLYIYTLNAQAGTASVDIRKLGLKDDVANLLVAVNPIKGKKLNFLGDSITYGGGAATRFTDVLASMLDCTCRNYGISGSTITYDENRNPMCVRYADMDDDADIVAVMGGTNDYWNNKPLGQMGDSVNTTFYGALDIMIRGLISKYPNALFYMVTPPHGDNGGNFDGSAKTNAGSMQDIANAVEEVAAKYSIPVLDVFNAGGLYPSISDQKDLYYSDGVHLNTEGQKKLAKMHAAFILSGGLHSGRANRYDYATETWVEGKGYQTAQQVQTAINGVRQLPAVTASDNGKFLRVVNGAWAAETVPAAEGSAF